MSIISSGIAQKKAPVVLFSTSGVQSVIFHYYKCDFHQHEKTTHLISEEFFFHCGLVKVVRDLNLDWNC